MLLEKYGEHFDLLLGRRTYDIWSGFWLKAPKSPTADLLNAATKVLVELRRVRPELLGHHPRVLPDHALLRVHRPLP
jgi:hypothetical protein